MLHFAIRRAFKSKLSGYMSVYNTVAKKYIPAASCNMPLLNLLNQIKIVILLKKSQM